jgi:tRNA nucleotidyltransferase/poly(A) polymerase
MALLLDGGERGELLDPHHGWQDLSHGLVRVLHDRSFVDDATRMLRGVRYEQRFGFVFESRTQSLLQQALQYVAPISGDRLRHEFERTFDEAEPEHAMQRMDSLGILRAVHADLHFDVQHAAAFSRARRLSRVPVQAASCTGACSPGLLRRRARPTGPAAQPAAPVARAHGRCHRLRTLESSLEYPSLTSAELCCLLEAAVLRRLPWRN